MLNTRQVHLDFHTSEYIPGVGSMFDPEAFATTYVNAAVNSVTLFARCHHGLMYYPSKQFPERIHPHLECSDLMVQQVKALHRKSIKAPIYITVQWDLYTANNHPEWLIRKKDGSFEGTAFTQPGFYQSLCVNTGYLDFLKKQTAEVCELLGDALDGIFFDIVGVRPCWCSACRKEMKQKGIDMEDDLQVEQFSKLVLDRFKADMSAFVRGYKADATIFYNAGHIGPVTKVSADTYSHYELESLPSGGWGYLHFPVTARYARTLGKDCMGMTGKFHLSWGDFHSLKSPAALEFECFRMLSYGFACSVGDQLEPRGVLHEAAYDLIGGVYRQIAEREAWARPSVPVTELALVTSETETGHHTVMPESVLGAVQLLEELAVQFDIIDPAQDYGRYKLLILTDDLCLSAAESKKLSDYVANGGKVISCGKGGLTDGTFPACFGIEYAGDEENYPSSILADGPLGKNLYQNNSYVIYQQGIRARETAAKAILQAAEPYFPRKGEKFCSHFYTPNAYGEPFAAAYQNGDVIVFTHPLFSQYRDNAPYWCKTLIANAIGLLLPKLMVSHNGPSTLTAQVMEQPDKKRYVLHVLMYIPVRKSATIDIVEDRTKVRDVTFTLHLPHKIKKAILVPEGKALSVTECDDGVTFCIPETDGYGMVELSYE
ncbi:MAG: beta-galactosidase trimerization domain-containing protein [Defluviitaleaceae bacterium]|nr:beta-galactosidase trimerization domain-containing protein [Defluviitaleaceae bacterium]